MSVSQKSIRINKAARSPEELFPLIELCREGKLKEVSEWIAKGNPIDPPQAQRRSRRQSPLQVAIQKGFYALAELLLDGGCDPMANGNALLDAVRFRNAGIAKLLLNRGVPANTVDTDSIFRGGPEVIKLFIEKGIDPSADRAYFHGLCQLINPLLFLLKEYKQQFPALQEQADMALCYYCQEGNLRAVSLLLWAGAQPNSLVPDPQSPDDQRLQTTALDEAFGQGRLDIIKRLKPQNYPASIQKAFGEVWRDISKPVIDYLLELGAPLNTKENGGSRLIERLFWDFDLRYRPLSAGKLEETVDLIEYIAKRGAKWIPDENANIRHLRDNFRSLDPEWIIKVFRVLKETGAATVELLDRIVASPNIQKRLGYHLKTLDAVLHPKPNTSKPVLSSESMSKESRKASDHPLPSPEELLVRAQSVLLDIVKESPDAHFSRRSTRETMYAHTARRRLGIPKGDSSNLTPIFANAAKSLNKRLKSFQVESPDQEWLRSAAWFKARLIDGHEWVDALTEAWEGSAANEHFLSNPACRLLALLRSGKLGTDFVRECAINSPIGLNAWENRLDSFLKEITIKTGTKIKWKSEGWGRDRKFRITIESECDETPQSGLNPALKFNFRSYTRDDLEQAAELFHKLVINAGPSGDHPLYLVSISSYAELRSCFPGESESPTNGFVEFLEAVPFSPSVELVFDFRDHARSWFVALLPKIDWSSSLASIRKEFSEPDLSERLGISSDAAKLLSWIERLRPEEFLGRYTPVVEKDYKKRIGIECPWDSRNFPAYIRMLVDEINDKTDYDLRTEPWRDYSETMTRIYVARKKSDMMNVLQMLHLMALKNGVSLDLSEAKQKLDALISLQPG